MMGAQLSMIEELYADDKRKGTIFKGLQALAREIRWVYGLLYSLESSRDMFSLAGKNVNRAIDELEHVTTALAMVVYDEVSGIPEIQSKDLKGLVDDFCKLELVGMQPAVPTVSMVIDASYVLPQVLFKVSEDIESKRKEVLLATLLKFITKVEDL